MEYTNIFTLEQQKALDLLDKYFSTTPKKIIQVEINEIFSQSFEGVTIDEYFKLFGNTIQTNSIE
jgi:hypothetical protein